ncbi:hybrid sensor histidine kinase/response regulator [Aspergillus homomorphus CBS 101889]|uniref:histidine kinase n=1 Tax=Aspergillus homomorphus (strain CBS 101889) TaxID=1450537 RepID=A0A395HLD1_ASPHC|nr:two-component sensor protein histidine protein kinase [Aspergillus homomorphus CBS 101889]RAL08742.1 two-component sensor protein histidine protein kinase [Aspergillus homomorphus CBS 101889]
MEDLASPASSQQEEHEADRRARELFHYFQPDNPALLPATASTDPLSSPCVLGGTSPNLVLTALTQLAAVKVGVQRAIISLIDRETLYVVAEASRSLNLGDNALYEDDGDGLWMGCSRGPLAGTLCEKTITLYPTTQDKYPFFVVDDLQQHPKYCQIPCVYGSPFFRYYAGTPLTTSNGINIGSLYVIDPRPNLTLTASHKENLGVIATAVMEYLETSRQSLESTRLMKVLSGLNSFVQNHGHEESSTAAIPRSASPSDMDRSRTPSPPPNLSPKVDVKLLSRHAKSSPRAISPVQDNLLSSSDSVSPKSNRHGDSSPQPNSKSHTSSPGKRHETFQRAANIMRESLILGEEGGVVIFSARDSFDVDEEEETPAEVSGAPRLEATTWAISTRDCHGSAWGNEHDLIPAQQMSRRFLRRMIQRFCKGALWYFHRDGTAFSSDDETASQTSTQSAFQMPSMLHPRGQGSLNRRDLDLLQTYFPRATRIIFAPLWDATNSRWFGGCFCWSSVETRIFSPHVELGGVLGFCSSLMTEDSRIRSQEADKKKGDFISSISHELRSPLHGILAAVEFLAEQSMSNSARLLLDTIRACSQTLLDTFEQILDFSKINSFRRKARVGGPALSHEDRVTATTHAGPRSLFILKVADVVTIVEDAIESICAGANHLNMAHSGDSSTSKPATPSEEISGGNFEPVDITLDVSMNDWIFVLEPGALRRIVMNVFGNALKYTRTGSISVHLEIQKESKNSSRDGLDTLLLTVSDTGRGISSDYLRYHLFTPFMQEDPLSPGTGLGLSLVNSIVRSLKGKIKIKSQLGAGTVVKISIPLTRPEPHERTETAAALDDPLLHNSEGIIDGVKKEIAGKTVCFVQPEDAASARAITNYLTDWYGIPLHPWSPDLAADLVIVDEAELHRISGLSERSTLLVLHRERRPTYLKSTMLSHIRARIELLSLPCGPYRLARTIQCCLQASHQPHSNEDASSSPIACEIGIGIEAPPDPYNQQDLALRPATSSTSASTMKPSEPLSRPRLEIGPYISQLKADAQTDQNGNSSFTPTTPSDPSEEIPRVLLVEDNPVNMSLLRRIVGRRQPIHVHEAMNGKEAVDAVGSMPEGYHYIFMDISMPVMDGFEATRAIRVIETERKTTSPAKIIALTGLGSKEDVAKAYAAGVDVFVTKPVSLKKVMQLMEHSKG